MEKALGQKFLPQVVLISSIRFRAVSRETFFALLPFAKNFSISAGIVYEIIAVKNDEYAT